MIRIVVLNLVTRARGGDKQAWDALVERYAPLIWSHPRRHRLDHADADDVGQSVWLHLVDKLDRIRDPARLPGWLATTTRRECGRAVRAARAPHTAGCGLDARQDPGRAAPGGRAGTASSPNSTPRCAKRSRPSPRFASS